jgi:glycerate kinase
MRILTVFDKFKDSMSAATACAAAAAGTPPAGCALPQALAEGAHNLTTTTAAVIRKHIAHDG